RDAHLWERTPSRRFVTGWEPNERRLDGPSRDSIRKVAGPIRRMVSRPWFSPKAWSRNQSGSGYGRLPQRPKTSDNQKSRIQDIQPLMRGVGQPSAVFRIHQYTSPLTATKSGRPATTKQTPRPHLSIRHLNLRNGLPLSNQHSATVTMRFAINFVFICFYIG